MQTQIYSSFLTKKGPELVTLFGYSSKSIPGLEINGLGKYGKGMKEKIVFLTKKYQIKVPLSRIVLNVEIPDEWGELSSVNVRWLEYPFMLLYWNLAGALPIRRMDECFALGAILIWGSAVLMMGWHAVIAVLSFHSPLYSAIMLLIATGPWLYLYYAKNKRR